MSLLAVKDLRKAFGGVRAVDGVSFEVRPGELLAMIGPNGAGKTTCFNLLNGQTLPDSGHVLFHGREVTGRAPREVFRLGVGRSFQVAAVFGSMSVRENVQLALLAAKGRISSLFSSLRKQLAADADALLTRVGLQDQAARHCALLSYGDLKRVELAMALAVKPTLLLMDEPTSGMDGAERARLMRLADDLACTTGMGVLFTEHDMDAVFSHAHRVIVLAEGKVIASGTPAQVRADPQVKAVYLGA